MYCSNCGKDIGEAKFCPDCGTPANAAHTKPQSPPTVSIAPTFDKNKIIIIGFLAVYLLFLLFPCVEISVPHVVRASVNYYELPLLIFNEKLNHINDNIQGIIILFWYIATVLEIFLFVFCIHGFILIFSEQFSDVKEFFHNATRCVIILALIVIVAVLFIRHTINEGLGDYRVIGDMISYKITAVFLLIIGVVGVVFEKKIFSHTST